LEDFIDRIAPFTVIVFGTNRPLPSRAIIAITMSEKEYTYEDLSTHNTKKDLYLVVHDKVYDVSSFVDEHP
jgi:cytochrome b involved in lipid metabolism